MYSRFEDVPARGGHEDNFWVRATKERTQEALRAGERAAEPTGDSLALVMVAGAFLRRSSSIRILDFGGGMGIAYLDLRRSLGPDVRIEHTVVELPRVADVGRTLFPRDSCVSFASELPSGDFDVVNACGALQYLDDPFAGLRRLLGYRAPYVLVTKIPAGANPRYATAQLNLSGSVVPCWMFNLDELAAVVRQAGYVVLSRAWSDVSLIRTYRTRGIPRSHRPERMVSLLLTPS